MNKLILIRYGQYDANGHLNEQGRITMAAVSKKLRPIIRKQKTSIICAKIPRAVESAQKLSQDLNIPFEGSYSEFYAAEEEDRFPNILGALELINKLRETCNVLIVIASREYTDSLPAKIFKIDQKKSLNRGEALILDYSNHSFTYL